MAKLKWAPKPHAANIAEIADFAEFECLRRKDGNVSVQDVARIILRQDDDDRGDVTHQIVKEAFSDLKDRAKHCGASHDGYPFVVNRTSTVVELKPAVKDSQKSWIYLFLLFVTRLNMKTQRTFATIDATLLFEHLCVEIGINFWGGPHAQVKGINFGTGRIVEDMDDDAELDRGRFKDAVDGLCATLQEGVGFDIDKEGQVTARDGKLDVVICRGFSDSRAGRLVGFGQCKTGTHWAADLAKLQPQAFIDKWLRRAPAVLPVRLYFVADRVITNWYDRTKDGGIFFDRCRLMEYSTPLGEKVLGDIKKWTRAAAKAEKLEF